MIYVNLTLGNFCSYVKSTQNIGSVERVIVIKNIITPHISPFATTNLVLVCKRNMVRKGKKNIFPIADFFITGRFGVA
jgi:hypothetical protein